ncbi:hypothetical protein [Nocardia otitidiscaviarum]|uniref:hypothetical protein n=1 Tax=Nocardia otitidiscaviarum TaxID=1823 RepID=UPI001894427E|nr:hypothetical protein [Nocardia otitidiscaviarum]MBF6181447.1 hypothetical protein [Nocardia otitidiscaviarum]
MTKISKLSAAQRRQRAADALDAITQRERQLLLQVRCGRAHHVAAVFDTPLGPVYESSTGPHAHGSRDFVDTAHGAHHHGIRYADLLNGDELADDALPASCECGPHALSRTRLQQVIAAGDHTIQLR